MFDLLRVLFYLLAIIFFMMCMPFVICHIADRWDAPEYPHSGFSPECPTWEAPENTLPPTCNPWEGVESEAQAETRSTLAASEEF